MKRMYATLMQNEDFRNYLQLNKCFKENFTSTISSINISIYLDDQFPICKIIQTKHISTQFQCRNYFLFGNRIKLDIKFFFFGKLVGCTDAIYTQKNI